MSETQEKRKSSNIEKIDYDAAKNVLEITFKGGSQYTYAGVSSAIVTAFEKAESQGSYFHKHIRSKFEAKRKPKPEEKK